MSKNKKQSSFVEHLPIVMGDSFLLDFEDKICERMGLIEKTEGLLCRHFVDLYGFASAHLHYGLHKLENGWVIREWAPNATKIYLLGDFNGWQELPEFRFVQGKADGDWELFVADEVIKHGDLYKLMLHWQGEARERIPVYAKRVVQDKETHLFSAQVWQPEKEYEWECSDFVEVQENPLIYEAHVGMSQERAGVGTYDEFREKILPRVVQAGYNTIQLMAIQEHPYYGSFGYHVSNFFAASSRFGTPEQLKRLVDTAHGMGLAVIMDLVHSHAVKNENEGLSRFDGTLYQYFHEGTRGYHEAWDSRCFDYSKYEVLRFLLSNCRYWLEEYKFDGFRFDGVTSMLYRDHGLGTAFTSYDNYFDDNVDLESLVYLGLANKLIHTINKQAITVAEDVSGMPGLAAKLDIGGVGFDYRLAMGIPDYWIKLIKHVPDDNWHVGAIWAELINRRDDEKTISYAESHDQALVGDKTIIFRLIDKDMYTNMHLNMGTDVVHRGVALHKMIRLITLATAGDGYLNFMGNEFGHPEWIDFPREGNGWSYKYARRQWSLAENRDLFYYYLAKFDQEMLLLIKNNSLLSEKRLEVLYEHCDRQILLFKRGKLLFLFNFNPVQSFADLNLVLEAGSYKLLLNSDAKKFAGHGRVVDEEIYFTQPTKDNNANYLSVYLPTRTAFVLLKRD